MPHINSFSISAMSLTFTSLLLLNMLVTITSGFSLFSYIVDEDFSLSNYLSF